MPPLRSILAIALLALVTSACGPANATGGPCAAWQPGGPSQTLSCDVILSLARARLGWQSLVISSATVGWGAPCPPNARCLAALGDRGWAVFTFLIGDPVIVFVHPAEIGVGLVADPPEPAPDYLL